MKFPSTCILALALVSIVAGCNRGEKSVSTTIGTAAANPAQPTVALVVKTLNNPFFIEMQQGAEAEAKKLGLNLIVQAADREIDVERQMQIVENLIERKVNVLCIAPSGSREIVPVIVKANQAGIPVIIIDTRVDEKALAAAGGKTATFIGSDNIDGGRRAGSFVAEKLHGSGNIAVLEGIAGHETGDARLRGFREEIARSSGIKIVASQPANWERDQGFNVFQNILQAHPEVNAVFACNDLMALGATEAIASASKKGQIIVVGFDAQPEAREAIKQGAMSATVAQFPAKMGAAAMENAHRILGGETISTFTPVALELVRE